MTHSTASALLVNDVGLHARPSVKLTQTAKRFASELEIALAANGPWVDAKPWTHSRISNRLENPRAARRAASSPFCAALPAWNGLHIVPNCDLSPAACVPAMPSAMAVASLSRPRSRAQAAAAPKLPTVPVE